MITTQCNQKCSKCSHWRLCDSEPRLPLEKLITALASVRSVREICIVGGEPLLFKDEILEFLRACSSGSLRTVVITNGVLMDQTFLRIVASFNIHLVVSIDTLDRDFWRFVRGCDSRDLVLANLEAALSELSLEQLSIQSVRAGETEPYLREVAEWTRSRGLFHSVQEYIPDGFGGSWTPIAPTADAPKGPETDGRCHAAGRNLSIMSNGDVFTCFQQPWIPRCERPLGNLVRDPLDQLLTGEYADHVQDRMRQCDLPCKVLRCNQ